MTLYETLKKPVFCSAKHISLNFYDNWKKKERHKTRTWSLSAENQTDNFRIHRHDHIRGFTKDAGTEYVAFPQMTQVNNQRNRA